MALAAGLLSPIHPFRSDLLLCFVKKSPQSVFEQPPQTVYPPLQIFELETVLPSELVDLLLKLVDALPTRADLMEFVVTDPVRPSMKGSMGTSGQFPHFPAQNPRVIQWFSRFLVLSIRQGFGRKIGGPAQCPDNPRIKLPGNNHAVGVEVGHLLIAQIVAMNRDRTGSGPGRQFVHD
jgi:hypothetical protein